MKTLTDVLRAGFEVRMWHDPKMRATRILVSKIGFNKEWAIADVVFDRARIGADEMILGQILQSAADVQLAIDVHAAKERGEAQNENAH